MNIAIVIPARQGSKSLKNKNLKLLNNVPLAEYTFKSINQIKILKFVLTNDSKIKKIARRYGINCDYKRPESVSNDKSSLVDTLINFDIWQQKKNKYNIDAFLILQVTSPLRVKSDIIGAKNYFEKNNFESLFSVSESMEHPYETINILNKEDWKYNLSKAKKFYRRQDYDINSYFINGAIYIVKLSFLRKHKKIISKNHGIYLMKKTNSIDIDDREDLAIASKILKN